MPKRHFKKCIRKCSDKPASRLYTHHSQYAVLGFLFLAITSAFAAPHKLTWTLLDAPINATWAANHGEAWREKGFSGFLFQGILDDFSLYPSEKTKISDDENISPRDNIIPGDWEALVAEINGAVNRLKAAGISHNFVRIAFAPEAAYFSNKELTDIAVKRMGLAGELCHRTGLCGIAFDTQSQSAIYDYRWDGYPTDISSQKLEQNARDAGKRMMRSFMRACPDGRILLITQQLETAAPLWYSFFEGLIESINGIDNISLNLAVYEGGAPQKLRYYQERKKRLGGLLRGTISSEAFSTWEQKCGISFTLEPIHYLKDIPSAKYPLESYRRALYAASVNGIDYTILEAPEGGWWHIPPDIAAQFNHLHQKGRAKISFAPPVPTTLDEFSPRIAAATALYLGDIDIGDRTASVLQQEQKTLLLAWNGIPTDMQIPFRTGVITITNLFDQQKQFLAGVDNIITIPATPGLLLLENLPANRFALPASMNIRLCEPISAGITRTPIQVELFNPLASPIEGLVALTAPSRYSFGTPLIKIHNQAGETISVDRTLQGISFLGTQATFALNINIDANPPLTRTFSFPVEPPECFYIKTDGPITGMLLQPEDKGNRLIIADMRGGIVCINPFTGKEVWKKRFRGTYEKPPLLLQNEKGDSSFALQNCNGTIRIFDASGTEKSIIYPGKASFTQITAYPGNAKSQAVNLAAAATDGTVSLYSSSGSLLKRFVFEDIAYITGAITLPESLLVVETNSNKGSTVKLLNPSKDYAVWEESLETFPAFPPIIVTPKNAATSLICLLQKNHALTLLNAKNGSAILESESASGLSPNHYCVIQGFSEGAMAVAIADAEEISLYNIKNEGLVPAWKQQLAGITALAALPNGSGVAIGNSEGDLFAYDLQGNLIWEEHRSTASVTGIFFYAYPKGKGACLCVITSRSNGLRGLKISQTMMIPEKH